MSRSFTSRVALLLFLIDNTCKSLPEGPKLCSKYKTHNFSEF